MPRPIAQTAKHPVVFDEFFEMGLQETVSPFLTPSSRHWGTNLSLKSSIFSACLLFTSFLVFLFFPEQKPLIHVPLLGVYFFAGIPSLIDSLEDISRLEINIDVLMTVAAFASVLIGSPMEGALLLVLFSISEAMEEAVTAKAKSAINSLHKLSPTKACVIESDGTILERSVKDISIATHILIKAGEVVPLDGEVIEGISSVNLVHLTGENLPVTKKIGDEIPAGALNIEGMLIVRVKRTSVDSTLARIIQLVTQAQEAKPKLQRWFDKMSKSYATGVIASATLFSLTFPFIFQIPFLGYEGALYRSLAFLIAASPCALIIALPIAYLSAVSGCARKGILLKGGITLDALASCKTIALDKTGTLTTGELSCLSFEGLKGQNFSQKELHQALAIAVSLEKNAVHPIAKAVIEYGSSRKIHNIPIKSFKSIPGYGLEGKVLLPNGEQKAYIGRAEYIVSKLPPALSQKISQEISLVQEQGDLLSVLLLGEKVFILRFSDTLRPKTKTTLSELKQMARWRLLMLTGDHQASAKKVAFELGLDEYYADLNPEDKLLYVTQLSKENGLVMIGDGVNDAPALARATVGICMGKVGSATAIEAADVVLLHDNLEYLSWLMNKAHQTQTIVKQNLFLASAAILFATIPALFGWIPLWMAVIFHEGGTVLVGLNALRLLRST